MFNISLTKIYNLVNKYETKHTRPNPAKKLPRKISPFDIGVPTGKGQETPPVQTGQGLLCFSPHLPTKLSKVLQSPSPIWRGL
jgi:hypothetical protein